jgi:multiple sugar transport system substrate-binding protein
MWRTTRREFLVGGTAAGTALVLDRAPARAQKREISFLSVNHFVPTSDDELRRQAEAFGKQTGITVKVDTIMGLQLPAKRAAEAQAQSGHDLVFMSHADPFLFENLLVDLGPLVETLGKQHGGWYPFATECALTGSGWKGVPWFWVSFPSSYNVAHFTKVGLEYPKTWDERLRQGMMLKKQGTPVGIATSHTGVANTTLWAVLWAYGAKVLEPDSKTPAINSDKTAQVIEWYKELYRDAMEPEVLSWDDASNNRCLVAGKCSWIHNPISAYNTAVTEKMPIAADLNHHLTPAGPAGYHTSPGINMIGIWKFSKSVEPAKEFIQFLFRRENYNAFIEAGKAFNMPPLRDLSSHPIWAKNPKFAMLPKEGEAAHPRGWPAKPNDAIRRVENNYVLPDMVAKAINGMPTKRAMEWAHTQVIAALKGQLKPAG